MLLVAFLATAFVSVGQSVDQPLQSLSGSGVSRSASSRPDPKQTAFAALHELNNLPISQYENPAEDPAHRDMAREIESLVKQHGVSIVGAIEEGFEDPWRWSVSMASHLLSYVLPQFGEAGMTVWIEVMRKASTPKDPYENILTGVDIDTMRAQHPEFVCQLFHKMEALHEPAFRGYSLILGPGCHGATEAILSLLKDKTLTQEITPERVVDQLINIQPFQGVQNIFQSPEMNEPLLSKWLAERLLISSHRTAWMKEPFIRELLRNNGSSEELGAYRAQIALLFGDENKQIFKDFGHSLTPLEQLDYISQLFKRTRREASFSDRRAFAMSELKALFELWKFSSPSVSWFEGNRAALYDSTQALAEGMAQSDDLRSWFVETIMQRHPARAISYLAIAHFGNDYYQHSEHDLPSSLLPLLVNAFREADPLMKESALKSLSGLFVSSKWSEQELSQIKRDLEALYHSPLASDLGAKVAVTNAWPLQMRYLKMMWLSLLDSSAAVRDLAAQRLRSELKRSDPRSPDSDFYFFLKEAFTVSQSLEGLQRLTETQKSFVRDLFASIDLDESMPNSSYHRLDFWEADPLFSSGNAQRPDLPF